MGVKFETITADGVTVNKHVAHASDGSRTFDAAAAPVAVVKTPVPAVEAKPKQRRGFAVMDPAKQRAIASKGGKASHEAGTGHEWNSEAAREAGRKGGKVSRGGRGKLPSTETGA